MIPESEPRTRARWLGVLLIPVALASLVWQAWLAGRGDDLPPASAAAPAATLGKPSLSEMLASVDSARLGMQAASAAAANAASAVLGPDEVEVCGLGRVKADELGQPKNMEPIQNAAQAAREQVLPVLLGSPDEVARAAGLLLQGAGALSASDSASAPGVSAREALTHMALTTRSPQVYAWAMQACQGQRGEGACQLLKADQWARLDPDNAIPWLHVASDASSRHDLQAVSEALFRVSHAARSDARWGALTATTIANIPAGVSLLARGALAYEVSAIDAGAEMPLLVASEHCSAAEVRDANRLQTCLAVAEVLNGKGSTLIEVALGSAIGARAGWSPERIVAGREERDAMSQLSEQAQSQGAWSCPAITKSLRDLAEIGQRGEMAAMRNALKQSLEGVGVLARRHREAEAKRSAASASGPTASAS
ncbi:MAG: hypothetical protein ABI605_20905 [Rhizobacter sp.]